MNSLGLKSTLALALTGWFAVVAMGTAAVPDGLTATVYDFTGTGRAESYGKKVTALVTANLAAETNIVMLDRAELQKTLREQAFGISGLVSSDAAAKIGQLTGAKVLVSGQVLMNDQQHLIVIANVIGTETGRLFATKVEGAPNHLLDLTEELSKKIAQTIATQTTNLTTSAAESRAQRIDRIVKSIKGTKRPLVLLNIMTLPKDDGKPYHSMTAESEFGSILLKVGFQVVDAKSEHKPDMEISGLADLSEAQHRSGLFSYQAVMELKVQERRTGDIITMDRQESSAYGATKGAADRAAQVQAVDALAERVLPLLAK